MPEKHLHRVPRPGTGRGRQDHFEPPLLLVKRDPAQARLPPERLPGSSSARPGLAASAGDADPEGKGGWSGDTAAAGPPQAAGKEGGRKRRAGHGGSSSMAGERGNPAPERPEAGGERRGRRRSGAVTRCRGGSAGSRPGGREAGEGGRTYSHLTPPAARRSSHTLFINSSSRRRRLLPTID